MLRSNVRLIFGGCAAVTVGVVSGWTALALRAPAVEQPAVAVSRQVPDHRAPAPAAGAEAPSAPPTPAPPLPSVSSTEKPVTRERSATASGPTGVWIDHTGRGAVEITECAGRLCAAHRLAQGHRPQERLWHPGHRQCQARRQGHLGRRLDLRPRPEREVQP